MLEFLFPRDWPRYAAGPQGPLVRNFAAWVVERGYTRVSAKCHVHRFREVLAYNRVAVSDRPVASATLVRWFAPWSDEMLYRATQRAAARFLTDRGLFVPVTKPSRFDLLVSQYRSHLIELRGLAPKTVEEHLSTVASFLSSACSKPKRLASIRSDDVERFIDQTSKRVSQAGLSHQNGATGKTSAHASGSGALCTALCFRKRISVRGFVRKGMSSRATDATMHF